MSDPFPYPETPWDRGKVLDDEGLSRIQTFERYRDVDGDAIPFRTLPGVRDPRGAYFTRGSGHDEAARYTESPEVYVRVMDRLARKFETARALMPPPSLEEEPGAEAAILAFGSTHWAVVEAREQLRAAGVRASYALIKALPLHETALAFLERHRRVYVVEQNRDAQLLQIVAADRPALAARLRSVLHYTGLPIDARSVSDEILRQEGAAVPVAAPRVAEGAAR